MTARFFREDKTDMVELSSTPGTSWVGPVADLTPEQKAQYRSELRRWQSERAEAKPEVKPEAEKPTFLQRVFSSPVLKPTPKPKPTRKPAKKKAKR